MSTPLIDHLLASAPAFSPSPDLPTHNARVLETHTLLFMAIASTLEREYGQPIIWSGSRHLPYPNNSPPSTPHHFSFTSGPNRIFIGFEIDPSGTVLLFGEPPITTLEHTDADDTQPTTE